MPPISLRMMCESPSSSTSPPRPVWASSATRFDIVPLAMKIAASLPSLSAAACSRRRTVGSPSRKSSPSAAPPIASRISSVGSVMVSLRRSIMGLLEGGAKARHHGSITRLSRACKPACAHAGIARGQRRAAARTSEAVAP